MAGLRAAEARFAHYLVGRAPAWTLSSDERFSYYAYVPPERCGTTQPVPVLAVVHGTERRAESCRDAFADFAAEHGCVVIAPLFPCGLVDPDDIDNYKRIAYRGIRFDHVLLAMVEEVGHRYDLRPGQLLLHGFSGGGQFAHRFYYLHPELLDAVSIGAPGAVTLIDDTRDWWVGTRDLERVFGKGLDPYALRRVPVQTVIGEHDHGSEEITVPPTSKHWMPDANHAGSDRQQRLDAVRTSLERIGATVTHTVMPGIGHDGTAALPAVRDFFATIVKGRDVR